MIDPQALGTHYSYFGLGFTHHSEVGFTVIVGFRDRMVTNPQPTRTPPQPPNPPTPKTEYCLLIAWRCFNSGALSDVHLQAIRVSTRSTASGSASPGRPRLGSSTNQWWCDNFDIVFSRAFFSVTRITTHGHASGDTKKRGGRRFLSGDVGTSGTPTTTP